MYVAARARQFLAHHPWVYWAVVLSVAAVVALAVHRQLSLLEEARSQWQTTRTVLVADAPLTPGDQITVSARTLPVAAIPETAIDHLPAGALLRQRVSSGEVLVASDLTQAFGPAARTEPGTVVVGLTDSLSRHVAIGLSVQVVAEGLVLASEATVVEVVDEVIFVAIPEREAPAIAAAAHSGLTSLVYLP